MNDDPFEVIDRLSGLIQTDNRKLAATHSLQGVHLDVLRYLGRCNRYSNTPAAVALYLNSTKGTISQSINLLVEKGYVSKLADSSDKRVVRLKLRKKGEKLLESTADQSPLQQAIAQLPQARLKAFGDTAVHLLRAAQQLNQNHSFGQCKTCKFFQRESAGQYRCGVTSELLTDDDTQQICVEHEAKQA